MHVNKEINYSISQLIRALYVQVYEIRGSYYYGELEGRSGLVALNHVEKCEWIYGDVPVGKGLNLIRIKDMMKSRQ